MAGKIIKTVICVISVIFTALLLILILAVHGENSDFMTQLGTLLFPTLAPVALVLSIVFGALTVYCLIAGKSKPIRMIALIGIGLALVLNTVTAVHMGKYVSVIKKNGGSYSFFKSLNLSSYWGDKPDEQVTYRIIDGEELKLSVYKNNDGATKLPVYVYIHGGGWTNNNSETSSALHRFFAENGFVVFSINYRLGTTDNPTWDKAIDDVACAMEWIYKNAENYGGDPEHICLCGESAGGNLCLNYAGAVSGGTLEQMSDATPVAISKVAVMYPVVDVKSYANEGLFLNTVNKGGLIEPYIGGTTKEYPERVKFISPLTWLTESLPPTLIIHGKKDALVTVNGSVEYARKAQEIGADVSLVLLPYENHATELFNNNMSNQADRTMILNFLK